MPLHAPSPRRTSARRTLRQSLTVLPPLPPLAQWKALEAAFEPMRTPSAMVFLPLVGVLAACAMSGQLLAVLWLVLVAAAIAGGQRLEAQFELRGAESLPEAWARRHAVAAWWQAASFGVGGFMLAWHSNPAMCLLLACALCLAMAQAAAAATFRVTIRGQLLLMAAPIAIICLLSASPLIDVAGIMVVLHALAFVSLADQVVARSHAALIGDRTAWKVVPSYQLAVPPSAADFQKLLGRDQTTGLPNRHSFMNLIEQECVRAGRAETHLSLLLLQWDDFATQHATQPQPVVDQQLAHIARRLRTTLRRPADLIASLGAGRFAAILPFTDAFGAATVARNLQSALGAPELAADGTVTGECARLSIGAATYSGKGVLPEGQLLGFAEEALASARGNGGNRINRYDPIATALRPAAYTGAHAQEATPYSVPAVSFEATVDEL